MRDAAVVFSTCATLDEARRIAGAIVEARLAACVQVLPGLQSVYRWQGAVEHAQEVLMLFKTTEDCLPGLKKRVADLHSYDTPEFVVVPVCGGSEKYLAWLRAETAEPE